MAVIGSPRNRRHRIQNGNAAGNGVSNGTTNGVQNGTSHSNGQVPIAHGHDPVEGEDQDRVENVASSDVNIGQRRRRSWVLGVVPLPNWDWLYEPEYIIEAKKKGPRIHQMADSLFSSTSGFTDFAGFLNLGIILLVLSNTRVALENVIKYGILIQPFDWMKVFVVDPYNWPSFSLVLFANAFILFTFLVEKLVARGSISERVCNVLQVLCIATEISFPAAVIWVKHPNPVFSCICLAAHVILFLKLISYVQVNGWCRVALQKDAANRMRRTRYKSISTNLFGMGDTNSLMESDSEDFAVEKNAPAQRYPDNLRLADLYYFLMAPTLCYELHFPRSARIRKRFLIKRMLEMIFLFGLMMSLVQQWLQPTVRNSMVPFHKMQFVKVMERLLKLSVPNHIIWLLFFYWYFHSCLNVVAEVLRFGDRTFYRDWWNAPTVQYFWQNWNIPVHRWAVRHLYKPMLRHNISKAKANITVFLLSAFFHEYLVSIPLQMFRIWSFSAMIAQVPMAYVVSNYLHGRYGNMAVWISLIIGQPAALLMYFHDYFILNGMGGEAYVL